MATAGWLVPLQTNRYCSLSSAIIHQISHAWMLIWTHNWKPLPRITRSPLWLDSVQQIPRWSDRHNVMQTVWTMKCNTIHAKGLYLFVIRTRASSLAQTTAWNVAPELSRSSELDIHGSVPRDVTMNKTNEMQLYRLIYYSKSALDVSGDVFTHHQEHSTVFTVSGSVHPSRCRLTNRQRHRWTLPEAVNTVECSWWWAKRSPETSRAD